MVLVLVMYGGVMKPLTKALKLARVIPSGRKTKAKCQAVHKWHKAVIEILAIKK